MVFSKNPKRTDLLKMKNFVDGFMRGKHKIKFVEQTSYSLTRTVITHVNCSIRVVYLNFIFTDI